MAYTSCKSHSNSKCKYLEIKMLHLRKPFSLKSSWMWSEISLFLWWLNKLNTQQILVHNMLQLFFNIYIQLQWSIVICTWVIFIMQIEGTWNTTTFQCKQQNFWPLQLLYAWNFTGTLQNWFFSLSSIFLQEKENKLSFTHSTRHFRDPLNLAIVAKLLLTTTISA